MNIHKSHLFWCELQGYKVLTHCHMFGSDSWITLIILYHIENYSTWDHWNVHWLILALGLVTSEHNRLRLAVLLGCFIIPGLRDFTSFNNREPKQIYFASSAPDACQVHLQNLVLASVVLSLLVIASILPSVPIQWVKGPQIWIPILMIG